jgi:hypothetical protein
MKNRTNANVLRPDMGKPYPLAAVPVNASFLQTRVKEKEEINI